MLYEVQVVVIFSSSPPLCLPLSLASGPMWYKCVKARICENVVVVVSCASGLEISGNLEEELPSTYKICNAITMGSNSQPNWSTAFEQIYRARKSSNFHIIVLANAVLHLPHSLIYYSDRVE